MFLTCRLWWRSFPSPAHQTRPTVTSSPGAHSRSEVWGAGVSWTAHLYRQVSSPSKSHLFCTSDHLLRSPSLGNVWHSFRNCHREFSISHLDIRTSQNHRTVSRSPHLKDRLEKKSLEIWNQIHFGCHNYITEKIYFKNKIFCWQILLFCLPSILFIPGGYPQFPHSTRQSAPYWPEGPGYPSELKTESEKGPDMREAMLNAFARTDRGPVISI